MGRRLWIDRAGGGLESVLATRRGARQRRASPVREKPVLVLLVGGGGSSPVEAAVGGARQAAARDLLASLLDAGVVERAVVAAADVSWTVGLAGLPVEIDPDPPGEPFHFGRRLSDLIRRYGIDRALYAGGGSAPLMSADDWRTALAGFGAGGPAAVTNNLHSSDWIAFFPAQDLLPAIAAQERDNALGWVLDREAGLAVRALPPCAASRFDLDTPADLLIARAHPRVGPHLRAALNGLDWPAEPVEGVLRVLSQEGSQVVVAGRSSSAAWSLLERETQCWVRFLVEERGMVASGRMRRGEVRSLVADFLERVGVEEFFAELVSLADAALLDNRVILAARGLWPSAADRFNADLLRWTEVQEPFLRQFSRAAGEAGIPILMGGQSVVNGGLMALLEGLDGKS